MKKRLFAKPDLCSGCGRCTYACSAVKEGLFQPSKSRVQINNFSFRGYSVPSICFQCPGAPCQKACPVGAMSRDENDVVVIDGDTCNGCGLCATACPYGMIEQTAGLAYKCDTCGGDPACVKECQPGALVYREQDKEIVKIKALQMKQRSTLGTPEQKRHALGLAVLKVGRED